MNRSRRFIAAAVILTLLCGCSRTQQDWRAAQQAGTPRAYQDFVARHPDSELTAIARQRLAQLTEEAAWHQATRVNTAAAYRQYLARYPNGSWSQDARIRMESRSLAVEAPAGTRPITPAAAQPVAVADGFAVQLGAFGTDANARTAWTRLSSRFGAELRGLSPRIVPVVSSGRRLYRLEARVASQAAGRALCRQLQQHSQGCLALP
jgi:hypothetical protein